MTDPIIRLTAEDFEPAMDFLNSVFGTQPPHDFEKMLPVAYRATDEEMGNNFAVKRGGHIRAIVGMFPKTWLIGNIKLRVAGIGGVSTHPDFRGQGLMHSLMNHACREMERDGYHLSCLRGQRQRYTKYGYERCGLMYQFIASRFTFKNLSGKRNPVTFRPMSHTDCSSIARAKGIHDSQPSHCIRDLAYFHNYCTNWHGNPFLAYAGDGRIVGYLTADKNETRVTELVSSDCATALDMVRTWVCDYTKKNTVIDVRPSLLETVKTLGDQCEKISIVQSGNWRIMNWTLVTNALLTMKYSTAPMRSGTVVIEVDDGPTLRIEVGTESANCSDVQGKADIRVDSLTAMRLLFGPLPPSMVISLPPSATILDSWCPLPLEWSYVDAV